MTRLSCHRFRTNRVWMWLNLAPTTSAQSVAPFGAAGRIGKRSLTSLQQRLVKTGGRLVKYARYYWVLLAESHLTRRLFTGMQRKIAALALPAG